MASTVHNCDILIVGAGIFGLVAALELKQRQKDSRITVLDPGPVPHRHAASTDISKVIRMDYGTDELYVEMMVRVCELEWSFCIVRFLPLLFLRRIASRSGDSGIRTGRRMCISRLVLWVW